MLTFGDEIRNSLLIVAIIEFTNWNEWTIVGNLTRHNSCDVS